MILLKFRNIFLCILFASSIVLAEKYQCFQQYEHKCILNDLNVTQDDPIIEPIARNASTVKIVLLHGIVPVLTRHICDTFGSTLESFEANNVSLEEIAEDTFFNCRKLSRLHLDENKIVKLHEKAFRGMYQLTKLWFRRASVPLEELYLRDSHNLKMLSFGVCNITSFPVETIRKNVRLENLEELYLYSNNLFDLEFEKLLKYAPNLKKIYLADNNFKCSRLAEILAIARSQKISIDSWYDPDYEIPRSYTPYNIKGIHCLDDELWETEAAKNKFQKISSEENLSTDEQLLKLNKKFEIFLDFVLKLQKSFDVQENRIESLLKEEKQ